MVSKQEVWVAVVLGVYANLRGEMFNCHNILKNISFEITIDEHIIDGFIVRPFIEDLQVLFCDIKESSTHASIELPACNVLHIIAQ